MQIQELKNWEKIIRRLYESNYNIIITGSNAKLLSKEISTALTGRVFEIELLPFSFKEFLKLKNIEFDSAASILKNKTKILKYLEEYLRYGGFYEVITSKYKEEVISQLMNAILYRDLYYRYKIEGIAIKILTLKLADMIGSPYNASNLRKKIKPFVNISLPTVLAYLDYLSSAYLVIHINNYIKSFQKREVERKTYFSDTGFLTKLSVEYDLSKLIENNVFLELKRLKKDIYYYKTREGYEVDFLIKEGMGIKELMQVCYANSYEEIPEREIRALLHAKEELKLGDDVSLTVITWDYEDAREVEWWRKRGKIRFVPLWKWLLQV